jgi:hypothetical protein
MWDLRLTISLTYRWRGRSRGMASLCEEETEESPKRKKHKKMGKATV